MILKFYPINLDLIYQLKKRSTLRSQKEFESIGLKVGQSDILAIKEKKFKVTCIGFVHVSEIGGRDAVWKNEGFEYTKPKFQQTLDFLDGKVKLYYYTIEALS